MIPCEDCITLGMCKAKFIESRLLYHLWRDCSILKDFLLVSVDDNLKNISYWSYRENLERQIKEYLTGKPYGGKYTL